MTPSPPIVFLIDVDNTLLDNDRIQQDLKDHLGRTYGDDARIRYWRILEDLFTELGYRDYLGALQRYRAEHPREVELLSMSSFLINYPFADRLFPAALEVLKWLARLGPTAILSDGDVVFQPLKVERAGLADAVDGRVLIYIHKEDALDDVERRYPAERYVLIDDKAAHLGGRQTILGRARNDHICAAGKLCSRCKSRRRVSGSRYNDRVYQPTCSIAT
jgi:FMN phosphatase YigB (HAD superfamily)